MGNLEKDLTEQFNSVFKSILEDSRNKLLACTKEELREKYWFFRYDDSRSLAQNLYEFNSMLDLYKKNCRTWEEHHNGGCCVVERVRDEYLMPEIKKFISEHIKDV